MENNFEANVKETQHRQMQLAYDKAVEGDWDNVLVMLRKVMESSEATNHVEKSGIISSVEDIRNLVEKASEEDLSADKMLEVLGLLNKIREIN